MKYNILKKRLIEKLTKKKKQLDRIRPLPRALVQNLDHWFQLELTYTSNAIEGNTLTRRETALIVEKGITIGGKSLVEHLETINHMNALSWLKKQIQKRKPQSLTEKDILYIHSLILKGIDDIHTGRYRHIPVRIAGSTVVLPNPRKVPYLMSQFAKWLKKSRRLHPVELAAEAHYQLVTIHPFIDGNGRTARLLMNMILLMKGYPITIIRKNDRLAYIKSLETAQTGGTKNDYLKIICQSIDRSLNIYLKAAKDKTLKHDEDKLLKIGELAKHVRETPSTIRHWTKEGLLDVAEVTQSGYQLYSQSMIDRIKKIHVLKKKRYTLKEIKEKL